MLLLFCFWKLPNLNRDIIPLKLRFVWNFDGTTFQYGEAPACCNHRKIKIHKWMHKTEIPNNQLYNMIILSVCGSHQNWEGKVYKMCSTGIPNKILLYTNMINRPSNVLKLKWTVHFQANFCYRNRYLITHNLKENRIMAPFGIVSKCSLAFDPSL